VCPEAAEYGQLNALQWLRENNYPWDGEVILYAAKNGHEHIVELARANSCPEPDGWV
jgi:hypothetical protein